MNAGEHSRVGAVVRAVGIGVVGIVCVLIAAIGLGVVGTFVLFEVIPRLMLPSTEWSDQEKADVSAAVTEIAGTRATVRYMQFSGRPAGSWLARQQGSVRVQLLPADPSGDFTEEELRQTIVALDAAGIDIVPSACDLGRLGWSACATSSGGSVTLARDELWLAFERDWWLTRNDPSPIPTASVGPGRSWIDVDMVVANAMTQAVDVTGPTSVCVGDRAEFHAAAAEALTGPAEYFRWSVDGDFGGHSGPGDIVYGMTFDEPGNYRVTATVYNASRMSYDDTLYVTAIRCP